MTSLERAITAMTQTGNRLATIMKTLTPQAASSLDAILADLDEVTLSIQDEIDQESNIKIGGSA